MSTGIGINAVNLCRPVAGFFGVCIMDRADFNKRLTDFLQDTIMDGGLTAEDLDGLIEVLGEHMRLIAVLARRKREEPKKC